MKLFLASYFTEVAAVLPNFLNTNCVDKKITFIPTAAMHEEGAFYIDTDKIALQNLGFIVDELEISKAPYDIIQKSLSETDFIFVGGGNTFFLLQELKRTGADKLIINHIKNGKAYISTSAGSCVLSKNIIADGIESSDSAPYLNGDFSALSIVDFYIYPHYGHNYFYEPDDLIVKNYYSKLDVKLISDSQVIVVDGNNIKIITV